MTVIDRSIVVDVPIDVATQYGEDPAIRTAWYAGMQAYHAGDDYPSVGTKSNWVMKSAGVTLEAEEEIVSYQQGEHLTFTFDAKMIKGEMTWRYTAQGDTTHVAVHVDYEMSGGIIGQAINALVVEKALISDLEKSLNNFKTYVESNAG